MRGGEGKAGEGNAQLPHIIFLQFNMHCTYVSVNEMMVDDSIKSKLWHD
jgi:hypothetical protein